MESLPQRLDKQIQELKQAARALSEMAEDFPAIKRNTARVLSSIKMMEINVSDVVRLSEPEDVDMAPKMRR